MNPWIKMLIVLIIVLAAFSGGVAASRNHYRTIIAQMNEKSAQERLAAAEAANKMLSENDSLKTTLEVKKNEANTAIDLLANSKLARVRLPKPTSCPSVQTNTASGSASAVPETGVLFEEAGRILDADRSRTQGIITEAERELNECRIVKEWAANQ